MTAALPPVVAAGSGVLPGGPSAGWNRTASAATVIIRGSAGSLPALQSAVAGVDGQVTRTLPIIDGLAARVPAAAVDRLRAHPEVVSVTPDARGRILPATSRPTGQDIDGTRDTRGTGTNAGTSSNAGAGAPGTAGSTDTGSLDAITRIVGAQASWAAGYAGAGVDIALIDTGVAPVTGLTSGNVVNGPDVSFDSVHPDVRYLDAYGHGTHVASIIAGRDLPEPPADYLDRTHFTGVAPDARLISLKVGAADGSADVSQVIAAIGWVTEHAHTDGLNIRVLNLSYGTDSGQDSRIDPLAYAVETAWRRGIVVVASGGNDGTSRQSLANPARDPAVIAVGAEDPNGTEQPLDDTVPAFSDRGTPVRHVDVIAPGVHVLGLRVPNGSVDQRYPSARTGRYFRGSGTSQAAAVVSGAVALLLQCAPDLTPDAVKLLLTSTATRIPRGTATNTGAGLIDVRAAELLAGRPARSGRPALTVRPVAAPEELSANGTGTGIATGTGTGTGSLDRARGSARISSGGAVLDGEQDVFAAPWPGATWAQRAAAGTTWSGGWWNGNPWTGSGWADATHWAATTWPDTSWFGTGFADTDWTSRTWVSGGWDSRTWVGQSWASRTWVEDSWATSRWE